MFLSEEKQCKGKRAFFMLKLFLILIGLTPGIFVFAQHIDNPQCNYINKNDLKEIVNTLAGESFQGRQTGTAGQQKAVNYISDCFEKAGLAPLIRNSYFEKFNLTEISWGEVYIKTEEERTLHNFEDIIYMSSTILNSEKTFELIFAGDGSREFLNQIDVKNKIVLVFASQLRSAAYKISDSIVSRGAAGILLVNPENDIQFESLIKTFKGFKLQKRFFLNHDTISRFGPDSYLELYAARYNVKGLIGYSYKYLQKQMKLKDISMLQPKTIKLKCEQKNRNIETENILGYFPESQTALF